MRVALLVHTHLATAICDSIFISVEENTVVSRLNCSESKHVMNDVASRRTIVGPALYIVFIGRGLLRTNKICPPIRNYPPTFATKNFRFLNASKIGRTFSVHRKNVTALNVMTLLYRKDL